MPYVGNSDPQSPVYARERDLLLAGFSYAEIAQQTGQRIKTISERNRLIHKVKIYDAFADRIAGEGIPSRIPADLMAAAWFVGIVDGEGCFVVYTRPCTARPQYSEFRLGIRIALRADDSEMLAAIRGLTGVGNICNHPGRNGASPSVAWSCEKIADLAEVLVPIFDTIPLRSKKKREFAVWRPLVIRRYLDTMGGRSNRAGATVEYRASFERGIQAISDIRAFAR